MTLTEVRAFDLFLKRCPSCEHLTIYGFWQQLAWQQGPAGVWFERRCEQCGHVDRVDWIDTGAFCHGAGI